MTDSIEQHRHFAEDLSWDFEHDPSMQCLSCEFNAVEVKTLLTRGWAECHQCGTEYTAEVIVE